MTYNQPKITYILILLKLLFTVVAILLKLFKYRIFKLSSSSTFCIYSNFFHIHTGNGLEEVHMIENENE